MLKEVVNQFKYLKDINEGYFIDGTLGAGGHSLAIANNLKLEIFNLKFIGIDKDKYALELARKNIKEAGLTNRFIFIHDDFKNIKQILAGLNVAKINGALIDLGVSSMQLDDKERGFSFEDPDALLDMRMNQEQKLSAFDILNFWNQEKLEKIFREYGEERYYRSIAKNICRARKEKSIKTVGRLLEIIKQSIPGKAIYLGGKHYATNVFRALRIAVNDELARLDLAVNDFVDVLAPGGRLAIISFHSSEDRIVKTAFRQLEKPCLCPPEIPVCACGKKPSVKILTKKPVVPGEEEIRSNPRARSAKFRAVERLNPSRRLSPGPGNSKHPLH